MRGRGIGGLGVRSSHFYSFEKQTEQKQQRQRISRTDTCASHMDDTLLGAMDTLVEAPKHPYSPSSLELPGGYVPAFLSQGFILGVSSIYSVSAFSVGWILSGRFKYLTRVDRLLVCWWLFTGLIHTILEGYFAFTPDFYKLPYNNFFAEAWKEYGKGDSRYPARAVTIVLVEGITAVVEGPASLLAVYAILFRKPYQHPLQLATSLGQLYGDAIYFLTVYFSKEDISAPGSFTSGDTSSS